MHDISPSHWDGYTTNSWLRYRGRLISLDSIIKLLSVNQFMLATLCNTFQDCICRFTGNNHCHCWVRILNGTLYNFLRHLKNAGDGECGLVSVSAMDSMEICSIIASWSLMARTTIDGSCDGVYMEKSISDMLIRYEDQSLVISCGSWSGNSSVCRRVFSASGSISWYSSWIIGRLQSTDLYAKRSSPCFTSL